ncbi:LacI family DNA-binding transcriptional regulator [soil metagenome]
MKCGAPRLVRRRRRATVGDVARRAGVSTASVSLAMSGKPGVASATRERIVAAANELSWRPSIGARSLLSSRAFAVGLILTRDPELLGADPFFPSFIAGVESVNLRHGYALMLQVVPDDATAADEAYRRAALEGRIDGVFLTDLRRNDQRLRLVGELQLAAVAVGRPTEATDMPVIAADDRVGIGQAVEHLVALGHRRIAFVGGPPDYVHSRSRLSAWRAALRRVGVAPGPVIAADFTGSGGGRAMSRLLELSDRPTAVVFANDLMAVAAMSMAAQAGLDIPREISIVGFDDIPLAAHVNPPLTTVRQDAVGWGRAAAETLLAHIEGRELPVRALPPSKLVVRASSTAAPGD